MKIDGYVEADRDLALKHGARLQYRTRYGDLEMRVKHTGGVNTAFAEALAKHTYQEQLSEKLSGVAPDAKQSVRDLIGIYHDHAIIEWKTTIQSDGKPIEPTRENFIDLLSDPQMVRFFTQMSKDCANIDFFAKKAEEELAGNSPSA